MRARLLAVPLALLTASSAAAQTATTGVGRTSLFGVSVGLPSIGGDTERALFTLGLHWTAATPGRPGLDAALVTMPRVLANGIVPLGARLGVALPLAAGPTALVIPSAGLSGVAVASPYGAGGSIGWQAGLGVALLGERRTAMRFGASVHRLDALRESVWLVEMGLAWFRRRTGG